MSESIYEAYCVELDAIVTIEEAQEAYFAREEPRTRFNFQCSDEKCRNLLTPPEITGVNYSSEEYKRTPHFRRNENYEHDENCYWGVYHAIQNEVLQNREQYKNGSDKNIFLELRDIAPNEAYDEFYMRIQQVKEEGENSRKRALTRDEIRHNIINNHNRTRSLAKIVDVFRALTDAQKNSFLLSLPDTPRHVYDKAFKQVYKASSRFYWTHIYYGVARAYKYTFPESGYRIFFKSSIDVYDEDNKKHSITSEFLTVATLKESFSGRMLMKELDKYSQSKEVFCCYILANASHLKNIDLGGGDSKEEVVIAQESSQLIVLREISPKCR